MQLKKGTLKSPGKKSGNKGQQNDEETERKESDKGKERDKEKEEDGSYHIDLSKEVQ